MCHLAVATTLGTRNTVRMKTLLSLMLVLPGCGGQSGESPDVGTCDVVAQEPLADVAESEWPAGLAEIVSAYRSLDGDWTGTLRCLDEEDEAATFTLDIDEALVLTTREGTACSEPSVAAEGETSFALTTSTFDDGQPLKTGMSAGSGATYPILMTGEGVDLAWNVEGALDSAIDKYRWQEGNSSSDATCTLVDIAHDG